MIVKFGEYQTEIRFDVQPSEVSAEASVGVLDQNVVALQSVHTVDLSLPQLQKKMVIQADEPRKTWDTTAIILQELLDQGAARDDSLFAVGGGVLTDVSAFAASIYMRGIACTLVPTTLLAMVDAAFGGKTGINFGARKNMVGTFAPAKTLVIQPDFLRSLPDDELRSGMGEVVKAAMLRDADLLAILQQDGARLMNMDRTDDQQWQQNRSAWLDIVKRAVMVKADIAAADFRESGQRAFLNLGHTFGHAAESVLGFGAIAHGTLVVWGSLCALRMGERLGLTPSAYVEEVTQLAESLGYPLRIQLPSGKTVEDLYTLMQSDKKKRAGQVRFVLQAGQGKTMLQAVDRDDVMFALDGGIVH